MAARLGCTRIQGVYCLEDPETANAGPLLVCRKSYVWSDAPQELWYQYRQQCVDKPSYRDRHTCRGGATSSKVSRLVSLIVDSVRAVYLNKLLTNKAACNRMISRCFAACNEWTQIAMSCI